MSKDNDTLMDLMDEIGDTVLINYIDVDNNCKTFYKGSPQDLMNMITNAMTSLAEKFKHDTDKPEEFNRIFFTNLLKILSEKGIELPKI